MFAESVVFDRIGCSVWESASSHSTPAMRSMGGQGVGDKDRVFRREELPVPRLYPLVRCSEDDEPVRGRAVPEPEALQEVRGCPGGTWNDITRPAASSARGAWLC